ncbi:MAG: hypothetical protein VYA84_08295 [Planctomycetota bacterium]|nr:hypothetical protein [Planctomycetota bacterium]
MLNGFDKRIEIYDLDQDVVESTKLAEQRPDLVKRAEQIFVEAHRPDPNWPLDSRNKTQTRQSNRVWEIKRERDRTGWHPERAISFETFS